MGFLDGGFGGVVSGVGSLIGGAIGGITSHNNANANYAAQKEFAQNGIRWRVEDAKRAGIHPLYALGASTGSFSPVQGYGGDYGISDAFANFGQGINRAAQAKMTREEREREQARQEMQDVFQLAELRQRQRESDAKIKMYESEAARNFAASNAVLTQTGLPPRMPSGEGLISGQGDSVKYKPDEVIISGQEPSSTAGVHPLWNDMRTGEFVLPVIDSNYGDSVTEDPYKNAGAEIGYAFSAWNGSIRPPYEKFSPFQKELLKTGDYRAYYVPLVGWTVARTWRSALALSRKYGYTRRGSKTEFRGKIGR